MSRSFVSCSRALGALVALAAPAAAPAQTRAGLTAEQATAMRQLGGVQISPDGKWVAYVVIVPDLKQSSMNADVWLVATGGGDPIRLTNSPKRDDQPRWSPDGRWIAFVSEREEKPQLWLISPAGGEAQRLTESKSGVNAF